MSCRASSRKALRSTGLNVRRLALGRSGRPERHDIRRGGNQRQRRPLAGGRRLFRDRLDSLRARCSAPRRSLAAREHQGIDARNVAAHAEAAITAEVAVAIEDRKARQLDDETFGRAVDRPGDRDAAPGLARGHRARDLTLLIERKLGDDFGPGAAERRAVRGPTSSVNSPWPIAKRPSASICQTKRKRRPAFRSRRRGCRCDGGLAGWRRGRRHGAGATSDGAGSLGGAAAGAGGLASISGAAARGSVNAEALA